MPDLTHLSRSTSFMQVLALKAPWSTPVAQGDNVSGYKHATEQRHAHWLLRRGLIESNTAAIETVIQALEYGFAQQLPAGNFSNTLGATATQAVGADAFFIHGYAEMRLLLQDYQVEDARLAVMDAKTQDAQTWLMTNIMELYNQDQNTTNRLLFDASALALGAQVSGLLTASSRSKEFTNLLSSAQNRKDGYMYEDGGWDSSYNAVSLYHISHMARRMGNAELYTFAISTGDWLLSRIAADGTVSDEGNTRTGSLSPEGKAINYPEVALALHETFLALGDDRYRVAGDAVGTKTLELLGS